MMEADALANSCKKKDFIGFWKEISKNYHNANKSCANKVANCIGEENVAQM